jgi:hypothetical protein
MEAFFDGAESSAPSKEDDLTQQDQQNIQTEATGHQQEQSAEIIAPDAQIVASEQTEIVPEQQNIAEEHQSIETSNVEPTNQYQPLEHEELSHLQNENIHLINQVNQDHNNIVMEQNEAIVQEEPTPMNMDEASESVVIQSQETSVQVSTTTMLTNVDIQNQHHQDSDHHTAAQLELLLNSNADLSEQTQSKVESVETIHHNLQTITHLEHAVIGELSSGQTDQGNVVIVVNSESVDTSGANGGDPASNLINLANTVNLIATNNGGVVAVESADGTQQVIDESGNPVVQAQIDSSVLANSLGKLEFFFGLKDIQI